MADPISQLVDSIDRGLFALVRQWEPGARIDVVFIQQYDCQPRSFTDRELPDVVFELPRRIVQRPVYPFDTGGEIPDIPNFLLRQIGRDPRSNRRCFVNCVTEKDGSEDYDDQ